MSKLLIVVDMQNDFITGPLGSPEAYAAAMRAKDKIQNADVVWATLDTHSDDYLQTSEGRALPVPHCIYGTQGYEILSDLVAVRNFDMLINKEVFGSVDLAWWVFHTKHKYESIELIGLCTDICVISNALLLKAWLPEMPITVDASCCAGTTPERHRAALDVMLSLIHI